MRQLAQKVSVVRPAVPAFGSSFGLRSLSLVFADFGTFVLFIFADCFDVAMIFNFLSSDLLAIPVRYTYEFALFNVIDVIECKL